MPRGGRRPGAGAPFGNLNALSGGDHAMRFTSAYLRFIDDFGGREARRALAVILRDAGFYIPPDYRFNGDFRGLAAFLYQRWRCGQLESLFDAPSASAATTPSVPQSDTPISKPQTPDNQRTIKPAAPPASPARRRPRKGRPR